MEEPNLIVNDDQLSVGRIVQLSDRAIARLNLKQIRKECDREKAEREVIKVAKAWRRGKSGNLYRLSSAIDALLALE